ncbi:MAG: hypothetical protein P1U59_05830 [Alcanivorax sp.]|jgi:hypothetical protein|uniref:hypothetical protein n=1 Tax=Alcanivorax sp. TaxID=1872427 RepID=UPI00260655A0|nr:hypothetical protein [Alcanivorax sp.]MDF1724020.1 hypothetical protein [Alcanivorax sp.]
MNDLTTNLEIQIELEKLDQYLTLDHSTWQALADAGTSNLRELREHIEQEMYDQHRKGFQHLASWTRWLSIKQLAKLAYAIGAKMAARLVGEMDPYFAVKVARRLTPDFLGEIAAQADPRKIREIIRRLPAEIIREVALKQIQEKQFLLLGRFADALSAPSIREVVNAVKDDGALLTIAFYMENTAQLSNVIRMIDNSRLASIVRSGTENVELWPKAIWVIDHVEGELKSRLGNIMAEQDERTLDSLVDVAHRQQLWGPVLRALSVINPRYHRKIVNLPSLRNSTVITELVNAAVSKNLLEETLPLVKAMQRDYQEVVAHTALRQGEEVADAVVQAAHQAGHWDLILDLAQHLGDDERNMLARLPSTHNPSIIEALMRNAAKSGKTGLLLDFARRFHRDGLQTVVEISLRDGGDLLQAFLDAARDTRNGWQAIASAVSVVDAPDMLRDIGRIYQRQNAQDQQAFREAANETGFWSRLEQALPA